MNIEILVALVVFAFVSSITPGPNNIMLMNSGANYGFKKTVPHLSGVAIGFTLMIAIVGIGVMQLFNLFPISFTVLKVLSICYLVYLAIVMMMTNSQSKAAQNKSKPLSFIQAALFQWVNPKAWTMALTAISVYAPSQSLFAVFIVAMVFGLVNLPCICSWIVLGQKMQSILTSEYRYKVFNITMALLLLLSMMPALVMQ